MEPPVLTRWRHHVPPSDELLTQAFERLGLEAHWWENAPGTTYEAHAHDFDKVLFCASGSITIILLPTNERLLLGPGDRLELPAGWEHRARVGPNGCRCIEGWRGGRPVVLPSGC
ncbi:MAG: cupin domain-containing protein [Dehalococcoidia bacterium]